MIRRAIAVVVLTAALLAAFASVASSADAGVLCVRPLPRFVSDYVCVPTNV